MTRRHNEVRDEIANLAHLACGASCSKLCLLGALLKELLNHFEIIPKRELVVEDVALKTHPAS